MNVLISLPVTKDSVWLLSSDLLSEIVETEGGTITQKNISWLENSVEIRVSTEQQADKIKETLFSLIGSEK